MVDFDIGINIPNSYITSRSAILAKVGAGKTYLAGVIEEEFAKQKMPFVVVDPMGAHWGIRSKYPILIMGGDNGDLELNPGDGRYIAKYIVDKNVSIILDINQFSKADQQYFAAEFGDELFLLHKKTSSPRHIFWEEADIFAPQRMRVESLPVLDTLVRRGRQFGIGSTLITQRPAVLNKDVLTQSDAFFFLNMVAMQDVKVIKDLISAWTLSPKDVKDYISRIMAFGKGDTLLFSPSWLNMIKVFKARQKLSFHAGQTPVYGVPMQRPVMIQINTSLAKSDLNNIVNPNQVNVGLHVNNKVFAAIGIVTGIVMAVIAL